MKSGLLSVIVILFLIGCQSTYSPKLSQQEKQLKKTLLNNVSKDGEFRDYVDIMFIKSCEQLHKYINPRGIKVVSASKDKVIVMLPSGRTMDLKSSSYSCEQYFAI